MTKRFISYAALAFLLASPVAALAEGDRCIPLIEISEALDTAGVNPSDFIALSSDELPIAYAKAAGFDVPEDSHPIGITFLTTAKGVLVSFIEQEFCVKYFVILPVELHTAALRASTRGA